VGRVHSFDEGFVLVPEDKHAGTPRVTTPEGFKREQFLHWAASLPEAQSPAWLGLPSNAEVVLLTNRATALASDMQKLQVLLPLCLVFAVHVRVPWAWR
jgi:dynein heavy chain 1